MNPFITNKTERPAYDVLGDRYTLLLSSEETGNAYSLFEFYVPKGNGTPPHIHSLEDESFYILAGEIDFTIDQKTVRARTGDVIFAARGIPHHFTVVSDETARFICLTSPGGFEKFFAAVGTLVTDKSIPALPPTEDEIRKMMQIAPDFGLKILSR
jgi:quercetin dioxygenase-like cupin family protein